MTPAPHYRPKKKPDAELLAVMAELISLRALCLSSTLPAVRAVGEGAILFRMQGIIESGEVRTMTPAELLAWVQSLGAEGGP